MALNNDLDYVGFIDSYFIRFMTFEKWTKKKPELHNSVDIYCSPTDYNQLGKLIEKIKGISDVKNAAWGYGIFTTFFQTNTEHYETLLITLINLLKDYNMEPIEMKTWEKSFGNELRNTLNKMDNQRTKQLLKIGKLDIKYKKP